MENKILFPSAAAALLQKKDEDPPGLLNTKALHGLEFSSFNVDISDDDEQAGCSWRSATVPCLLSEDINKSKKNFQKSSSDSESSTWESDEREKKSRPKRHKKSKRKKKKKHKSRVKEDSPGVESVVKSSCKTPLQICSKPDTIWLDETKLDYNNVFRRDYQPDQRNYEFTSLYKNDVANFRPLVNCQCLGLGKWQSLILYPNHKRKKKRSNVEQRYFSYVAENISSVIEDNSNFVNAVESEHFIPLVQSNHKKNENNTSNTSTDNPSGAMYPNPLGATCLERNRYFSEQLSNNPTNIDMWLTFVDYQDELITTGAEEKYTSGAEEKYTTSLKAIGEKKMSILEKAMLLNPLSIQLIVKYMQLASETWTNEQVKKEWKNILFKLPNQSVLWRYYLLYVQCDILSMNVSSVINAYRRCFRMLIGFYNGSMCSHQAEQDAEEQVFVVFLQMVIFLWLAGHTEKAICMLQSLVEFNCSHKKATFEETDHERKLKLFEQFFESEEARFGEVDAHCWDESGRTVEQQTSNLPVANSFLAYTTSPQLSFEEQLENLKNEKTKKDIWIILENIRSVNEFLPFRGKNDDCEDTDRIVLFDDVSFSLFQLSLCKFQLLLSYLLLLGVPIPKGFLNKKVYNCFSIYYVIKEANSECPCFCHSSMFNQYIRIDSMLLDASKRPNHEVVTSVRTIISQSLAHLDAGMHIRQLSQIWFHFESFLFRYEFEKSKDFEKKYWLAMKKFVKNLLKVNANRSCVALWSMYALYEWNIANLSDTKKIFSTALQMSHQDKDDTLFKVAKIIRVVVDIHLDWKTCEVKESISLATKSKVLNTYIGFIDPKRLEISDEETPNPVSLLKVCNILRSMYTSIIQNPDKTNMRLAEDFVTCYLVFVYLFQGVGSLMKALEEIEEHFLKNDGTLGVDLCDSLCHALLLLKCHKTGEAFKAYKRLSEKCFKLYPGNEKIGILFISAWQHGLGGYHVRRVYEEVVERGDVHACFTAIAYEEKRMEHVTLVPSNTVDLLAASNREVTVELVDAQSGLHNRVQSLYTKLLRRDEYKCCVEVWINYLAFQLKYGSEKQAVNVLYAALKNCPANKRLYLFACEKFGNKFDEMLKLMDEKEVRVKLIIEELDILLEE